MEHTRELVDVVFNNGLKDVAGSIKSLGDPEREVGLHQRWARRHKHVVQLGPRLAPDLEHILKASRRHERHPCPLALQHRVGGHGRSVHHVRLTGAAGQALDALKDRPRRVVGRRPLLMDDQARRGQLHKVSEGATGINSQT